MFRRTLLALCCAALTTYVAADVVIQSPSAVPTLTDEGLWKSLQGTDGSELCVADAALPFAQVSTARGSAPCTSAKLARQPRSTLGFAKTGTELTYETDARGRSGSVLQARRRLRRAPHEPDVLPDSP